MSESSTVEHERGLLWARRIDASGRGHAITWDEFTQPRDELVWIHLQHGPEAERWLREESGVPDVAIDSLLVDGVRPRCTTIGHGELVVLRGVNMNPGQQAEDMVAVRGWFEAGRVVTVRVRRVMAIQAIRERLDQGKGPRDAGEFFVELVEGLLERMRPVIDDLDDEVDGIQEALLIGGIESLQSRVAQIMIQTIRLRRHMAPSRDALNSAARRPPSWLSAERASEIGELSDRLQRLIEDTDVANARATVCHEQIAQELAGRLNTSMYRLSVIAGIFLPLSLITGLLGINVGGVPGTENASAFWIVTVALVVMGLLLVVVVRRMKML